jgi:endo-1,4-beta-xylanase
VTTPPHRSKLKLSYTDGTSESVPLASATVSTSDWTQLKTSSAVPLDFHGKTLSKAEWWISTAAGTGDLLLDDATLKNGA